MISKVAHHRSPASLERVGLPLQPWLCLAQASLVTAAGNLFAEVSRTPAAQSLPAVPGAGRRIVVCRRHASRATISGRAVAYRFPWPPHRGRHGRPEDAGKFSTRHRNLACSRSTSGGHPAAAVLSVVGILPHEARLPHADVISERLETLVALSEQAKTKNAKLRIVITNVAALLQRTFSAEALKASTRTLNRRRPRGHRWNLIEALEGLGYEPEAQVTQKGEIALRGGILDVYPMTSPWPVAPGIFWRRTGILEAFRPITQVSRDEITSVTLPPGGELGILKQSRSEGGGALATFFGLSAARNHLSGLRAAKRQCKCRPLRRTGSRKRSVLHFLGGFQGTVGGEGNDVARIAGLGGNARRSAVNRRR